MIALTIASVQELIMKVTSGANGGRHSLLAAFLFESFNHGCHRHWRWGSFMGSVPCQPIRAVKASAGAVRAAANTAGAAATMSSVSTEKRCPPAISFSAPLDDRKTMNDMPYAAPGGRDGGGARPACDYSVVADLVASAKNGDRQAWHALVERYAPLIWSICRRYGISGPATEDVGQHVWLHLVENLNNLRDPAALPGWLATTTRRECWRIRRAPGTVSGDTQVMEKLPDEQAKTVEHELLMAERQATLREAFARLPLPSQRLLALLVADPPVPYAEISARLGIPIGSIGPSRSRSLDRLRRDPAIIGLINGEAGRGPS